MVEECFREARITDELRPASIKKYGSSIKNFLDLLGPKNLTDLITATLTITFSK